ncbi:PQ loop repeat family protein [Purpureocillium lavendulum]|uniref:PQ loop repeat family protein n=1 Tax=Purpureocillium lavendulum TaxID=1247861 RepID=A0AB34FZR0_9HYPO|nr:PQ loop repeat family protein [Purpureocillium lavendulum]
MSVDGYDHLTSVFDVTHPRLKPPIPTNGHLLPGTESRSIGHTDENGRAARFFWAQDELQDTAGRLVLALAGIASAVPRPAATTCQDMSICIDGMSECDVPWGGCYNPCSQPAPTPAPCPASSSDKSTITAAPIPTAAPEDDCHTRTVCVDAINSCGIRYGGCIPDCKPWKLSVPPCPATTSSASVDGRMTAWKRDEDRMTAWKSDDGTMTAWKRDDDKISPAYKSGFMTAWKKDDGKMTAWKEDDGYMTAWKSDDGKMTAWKEDDGKMTAWKEDDGYMTAWKSDDGMMTAWKRDEDRMTAWKSDDGMMTAWKVDDGKMTAWKEDDGMMTAWTVDDGMMTAWAPQPTQ